MEYLIAARSKYSYFTYYHKIFKLGNTDLWCVYGYRWTQIYLFICLNTQIYRDKILFKLGRELSSDKLLGTLEKIKIFSESGTASGLLKRWYYIWSRFQEINKKQKERKKEQLKKESDSSIHTFP